MNADKQDRVDALHAHIKVLSNGKRGNPEANSEAIVEVCRATQALLHEGKSIISAPTVALILGILLTLLRLLEPLIK